MPENYASHRGTVISIDDKLIKINISLTDACQNCSGRGGCIILNSKKRTIEVPLTSSIPEVKVGEEVIVKLNTKKGLGAVFYAYLLPVLILVFTVVFLYCMNSEDSIIAISAIGVLILYYIFLYIFRKKINNKINFFIEKSV